MAEFKIDKPGIYADRHDRLRTVLPIGGTQMPWYAVLTGPVTNEGLCAIGCETSNDLVRYVGPLSASRLQQIKDALAQAEEAQQ